MKQDDRTEKEKQATVGFWVANDSFMSGWGRAPGRSIVACPVVSMEDCCEVEKRFRSRGEFKRVRFVQGKNYSPRLTGQDHLHIYNTTTSFRYAL